MSVSQPLFDENLVIRIVIFLDLQLFKESELFPGFLSLLSVIVRLHFSSPLLGNCISYFLIVLFCPLVGSAPMVGSVWWTAEEILLPRQILCGLETNICTAYVEELNEAIYVCM